MLSTLHIQRWGPIALHSEMTMISTASNRNSEKTAQTNGENRVQIVEQEPGENWILSILLDSV